MSNNVIHICYCCMKRKATHDVYDRHVCKDCYRDYQIAKNATNLICKLRSAKYD
ncbi:MAG: hypothetical protein E7I48_17510 [Clostridium celatum]|nr:hypothetical protein [Clostridium celatum]